MLLGFIGTIIIVRYLTMSKYGFFSLALTVIGILAGLSTLGLEEGATRYIAYFKGKKEEKVFKCKDKISLVDVYGNENNFDKGRCI